MISHPLKECFILKEKINDMLTKGVIKLDKKYVPAAVNMVAFGSFAPTNIEPSQNQTHISRKKEGKEGKYEKKA